MSRTHPPGSLQPSRLLALAFSGLIASGCSTLPEATDPTATYALPPASTGPLARTAREIRSRFSGEDALLLIPGAADGMNSRLALIDSAQSSLDLQYFTWANDESGNLVLYHLLLAAERGVRVRLLIDDLYLVSQHTYSSPDSAIATLDSHPNIEVKIFNPGKYRSGTVGLAGNFATTFSEFNRRMHNKLLTADGHFAILGGRNLANEYFGLHQPYNFLDIDVLVAGPVTHHIASAFDIYWNSSPAVPGRDLRGKAQPEKLRQLPEEIAAYLADRAATLQAFPLSERDWSATLSRLPANMDPGSTLFLQDKPVTIGARQLGLYHMIEELSQPGVSETLIVTPYLIPVGDFMQNLQNATDRGVRVKLLTASLASGDHSAVHAHYKKYRRAIIATGAALYESRHQPDAALRRLADTAPVRSDFIALHPKTAVADRERCFIGSLNLDPRAIEINTENGLLINSPPFCGALADLLALYLNAENAWRVTLGEDGKPVWTSSQGSVHKAPARSSGQRVSDFFFRWLPLEKQL